MNHFTVTTRDKNHRQTRRIVCVNLETAYTVAMQLRKRVGTERPLPMPTTPITITALDGPAGAGSVVACLTWPGAPTKTEAIAAGELARWRWIDPTHTAGGACLPEPPAGRTAYRLPRWRFAEAVA